MLDTRKAVVSARSMRLFAALGALACCAGISLGALAAHGSLTDHNRERLAIAAVALFANGLGIAALAPGNTSGYRRNGLALLMIGMIVFAASLSLAALAGLEPAYAPLGGGLMMAGWALVALGFVIE